MKSSGVSITTLYIPLLFSSCTQAYAHAPVAPTRNAQAHMRALNGIFQFFLELFLVVFVGTTKQHLEL